LQKVEHEGASGGMSMYSEEEFRRAFGIADDDIADDVIAA
jgi:hypothetical protein